jgi:hypothetical protein
MRLQSVRAGMLTEAVAIGVASLCGARLHHLEFHTYALGMCDAGVERIVAQCPQLRTLIIFTRGMACTSAAAVCSVARHCPLLRTVVLDLDPMTDDAIDALARSCPQLAYVCLVEVESHYLTDASVQVLVRQCRTLTTLDVRRCALLTDASTVAIARYGSPCLTHVYFPSHISADAIDAVRRVRPHLCMIGRNVIWSA